MGDKRATDDQMDVLHALQCSTLMAEVKRYTDYVNPETKKLDPQPVPPALLAQVTKFLKDNGIDSPARASRMKDSLGALPNFKDVEVEHKGYQ